MLNTQHFAEFVASGLNEATIKAHKIQSIDQKDAEKILGFQLKSGGWSIEYPGTNGSGPGFVRIKPDIPFFDENGRAAKYLTAKGAGNRLFIPAVYTEQNLSYSNAPTIITEGEKKALKGAQELPHFIVLGVSGVWCFKAKGEGLIDDFKKINFKNRTVYICFDSDVAHKPEILKAENEFAKQLDKLGADVHICRLPQPSNEKVGLDDYLLTHSGETFVDQVLDPSMLWTPRGNLHVEEVEPFIERPIPFSEDIVSGLLPSRGMAMLAAYSKMGKSILAVNLGLCISSGRAFLNQFSIPEPTQVLYIQEEISERSMQVRLRKMIQSARSEGFKHLNNFKVLNKSGIKLDSGEGLRTAMRLIRSHRPLVVIWDCLYRLHTANENKADEMQKILDKFEYLSRTFGIAQVIVHHFGNPTKDSEREGFQLLRGSSVFGAFGDTYLTLTRYKRKDLPSNYQRLSFTLRNAEAPEDLILYRNPGSLWYELTKQIPGKKGKIEVHNVIFAVKEIGGRCMRQDLIHKLIGEYKVSERTAIKVITEAFKLNRIGKDDSKKEVEYFSI